MTANEQRQMGRAKNAALSFLERKLSVPKIYIDADWAGQQVDVLAIDRDGVGDVHAILLFASDCSRDTDTNITNLTADMGRLIDRFAALPAQFKYVAAVDVSARGASALPGVPVAIADRSFAADGLGRVGFLAIEFSTDGEPQARIVFKPERFRARIAELADRYVQEHKADWEIRA
jgi:hypothetical protein